MSRQFVEVVRFEQTLFALPFAYCGMLLAANGWPGARILLWVTLAMVGARTAGMCANRLIDRTIDKANPRTKERALPAGRLSSQTVAAWMVASFGLLVHSAGQLNPTCAQLSPVAVAILLFYSYTKRFTWACHLVLGLVQACAPIGGWLAVTGHFHPVPLLLGLAIFLWVAGFDILYACQDYAHDRAVGLFSIPARFGMDRAFRISEGLHIGALLSLLAIAGLSHFGPVYLGGLSLIAGMLWWQHKILTPTDLSRIQQAFFHANVAISLILLLTVGWEVCR